MCVFNTCSLRPLQSAGLLWHLLCCIIKWLVDSLEQNICWIKTSFHPSNSCISLGLRKNWNSVPYICSRVSMYMLRQGCSPSMLHRTCEKLDGGVRLGGLGDYDLWTYWYCFAFIDIIYFTLFTGNLNLSVQKVHTKFRGNLRYVLHRIYNICISFKYIGQVRISSSLNYIQGHDNKHRVRLLCSIKVHS